MINGMENKIKKMATDIKDPKSDVLRIEQLVNDIKRGLIKLPRFQRGYTWKIDDILKLLDSIYK